MPRPKNLRQQRLAGELQQHIADIVRDFADQSPGMIGTMIEISEVRLTPDLQQVRAYALTRPPEKVVSVVRLLNQYQKEIRYALSQRIRHLVKVMPTVQFFVDEMEIQARRIEELLRKLPPPAADNGGMGTA